MKIKHLVSWAALGCSLLSATAQTQVTGTVVDKYGTPVSGAKVQVVGTTTQTQTDFNGAFSMSSLQRVKKLSISAPGRTTRIRRYKAAGRSYELRNSSFWYQPIEGWRPFVLFEMAMPSAKKIDCAPWGCMVGTYYKKIGIYGKFVVSNSPNITDDDYYGRTPLQTGEVKGSFHQYGGGLIFCPYTPLALYAGCSSAERVVATENENGEWIERYHNSWESVTIDCGLIFQRKHFMCNLGTSVSLENGHLIGNFGIGYIF